MIIYHASKRCFVDDVFNGKIADEIDNAFVTHLGRHTSPNEVLSWKNSMMHMYKVINTEEIPDDSEVAIEYQIPLTSKRIDFIISGQDSNDRKNLVIVELKQWEYAKLSDKPGILKTRFQHGESETTHPSYQAWSYAYMLENYSETIREQQINIAPCAFLHNYQSDNIIDNPCYEECTKKAPVFFKSDAQELQDFIKSHIKYGTKDNIIWLIDKGRLRPSKQLADALSSMLRGNNEFVLLDDQKVLYETALKLARNSVKGEKQVLIVEGGPGTGKSVLAINLLVQLTKEGLVSQYVSKNAAPRDVYTAKLSGSYQKSVINNLFVGSGRFIDTEKNFFDALIVDEAHRLNLKSGLYGNQGSNQIVEIINASKFSVFFVDDRQRVHIKDIGSRRSIEKYAIACGAVVHNAPPLSSQFRCNGSDGYLSWLDNTLQIKETANIYLSQDDYDFRIFTDPNQLFNAIERENKGNNRSRLVAGYCWDWNSKNDPSAYDITIQEFSFQKRWNLNSDKNLWIINKDSINEIGCIHTCQGLELDYIGVIIGNDLRFENGKVLTDVSQRSKNDQSVKGFKKKFEVQREQAIQEADEIIKNTYRTLMTRGMKGCYIYCCDPALAEHIQTQLQPKQEIVEDIVRIEPDVNEEVKYVDYLPLYSIRAACGYFGEGETVDLLGWVRTQGIGRLNRNMYVVQAVGNSMMPIIHDSDFCVFRANPAGSRQGKIVLTEHRNYYDTDNAGNYSIKIYTSKKKLSKNYEWEHEEIILEPKNKDYNSIIISEEESDDFRVIGEFIGIVDVDTVHKT